MLMRQEQVAVLASPKLKMSNEIRELIEESGKVLIVYPTKIIQSNQTCHKIMMIKARYGDIPKKEHNFRSQPTSHKQITDDYTSLYNIKCPTR